MLIKRDERCYVRLFSALLLAMYPSVLPAGMLSGAVVRSVVCACQGHVLNGLTIGIIIDKTLPVASPLREGWEESTQKKRSLLGVNRDLLYI